MPDDAASAHTRDRIHALLIVCVLAVASLVIAFLGATGQTFSNTSLMDSSSSKRRLSSRANSAIRP